MSNSDVPLLDMYRTMLTIRHFEERCNYLFMQGRIPSTLHLYIGQEAVATGVTMRVADQTVYHDAAHPSALVLPVASSDQSRG